jgi:alpha-N-arabinofuranosidase
MRSLVLISVLSGVLVCATAEQVDYAPLAPSVIMPDGTPYLSWSDRTQYTKTYHVDQNHPRASDENPGSEGLPLRTINRAAQVVQPGERVRIHGGIYREMIRPRHSGEGPDRMIAYEAVPGEVVIVRGSRIVQTRWERSRPPGGSGAPSRYSKKLWMTVLPDTLFEDGYNPFQTPNATDEEMELMPWALSWKGRLPYTLPRGILFQDGRRMQQMATYEDLVRLPGSYWVGPDGRTVHIHAFDIGDPNGKLFEATTQPHIFRPQSPGFGFIRVSGLTLEHCANSFLRTGVGALFTMGGHHWIIERNTVRHSNSVGVEIGFEIYEGEDKRYSRREDPNLGHTIVRQNQISDCGTAGIRGLINNYALVENNEITDCGWQDAEYHWETAGIKLLINTGTLVRNNRIARIEAGCGIWLDWDNRNSRVTGNVIRDISTVQGGVFVEASQHPNMVDHNIFWNIDGQGVRAADTDQLIVAHNLFGRIKEELVIARVATDRSLGGRRLTASNNRVVNNIFVDAEKPINFGDTSNTADYNVYLSTGDRPGAGPLPGEVHSVMMRGDVSLDSRDLVLMWKPGLALPMVPVIGNCDRDFAGRERTGATTVPGPFLGLSHATTFKLDGQ